MPGSNYTPLTAGATTVISGTAFKRVNLLGIFVNKTLVGTIAIKTGSTTIGTLAVGSLANTYWAVDGGTEIADLQLVSSSASDDVAVAWNNL